MRKVAKFEKVSFEQFKDSFGDFDILLDDIKAIYEEIKLPKRATKGSAGYDFYSTINFSLHPEETVKIPTGVRARMDEDWMLALFPRSGLGFKFRLQLDNTVGIIDSDYYNSDNEGHIFIKVTNDSKNDKVVSVERGSAFAQGIFLPYGITEDDDADGVRNGGFGSTSK